MTDRLARNLALFKTHPLFIGVDLGSSHHAAIILPKGEGFWLPLLLGEGWGEGYYTKPT